MRFKTLEFEYSRILYFHIGLGTKKIPVRYLNSFVRMLYTAPQVHTLVLLRISTTEKINVPTMYIICYVPSVSSNGHGFVRYQEWLTQKNTTNIELFMFIKL
jgi:hypothetical protein